MNKYNVEKQQYVELLNKALEPLTDFGNIRYLNVHSKGTEYIKYTNAMGSASFMDVTSLNQEKILLKVLSVCSGNKPAELIEDKETLIAVARLFEERNK